MESIEACDRGLNILNEIRYFLRLFSEINGCESACTQLNLMLLQAFIVRRSSL